MTNKAWDKNKVDGIVTTDIKPAFDGVLRKRTINKLWSQGWPNSLLWWTSSFISNRSVRIRLDQTTTDQIIILCGLPQETLVTSILFLLNIEHLI